MKKKETKKQKREKKNKRDKPREETWQGRTREGPKSDQTDTGHG